MDGWSLPPRPSRLLIASLALLQTLIQGPTDTTAGPRNHAYFEMGAAVGATSPFGGSGLAFGLHVTSALPNAAGMDFSIASYIDPLTHGDLNLLTDLDVAYLATGHSGPSVVLRGGLTTVMVHGMALGLNAGAGVMVPVGKTISLRADYTFRGLLGDLTGLTLSGLSVGVGVDY